MDPGYSQPSPWSGGRDIDPGYSASNPWSGGRDIDPGYSGAASLDAANSLVADHVTVQQELFDQASRQANIAALGGRVGRSIHRLRSTGVGNSKSTTRIDFSLTFAEQPTLATGVELTSGRLDMAALPVATVGVYKWVTDQRGLYVGAHLWVAVSMAQDTLQYATLNDVSRGYVLQHHLTFEGMAIRDVSYDAIYQDL